MHYIIALFFLAALRETTASPVLSDVHLTRIIDQNRNGDCHDMRAYTEAILQAVRFKSREIHKRSAEETSLSQADLSGGMCFIMYTSGAEEKLSCIQRTACEDPKTASEYATAAKMVYKVHKMVGLNFSPKYETVLNALEDAKSHSLRGGDCAVYNW